MALLCLTRPDGGRVYILSDEIVAVIEAPGVGPAPTEIFTVAATFSVSEHAQSVIEKLGWTDGGK